MALIADFFGLIVGVGIVWALHHYRLVNPTRSGLRQAREVGGRWFALADLYARIWAAGPIVRLLQAFGAFLLLVLGSLSLYCQTQDLTPPEWFEYVQYGIYLIVIVSLGWSVYMASGRAVYAEDPNGDRIRNPEYLRNEENNWLNREGQVLRYQDQTARPLQLDDRGLARRFHLVENFQQNGIALTNVWWDARDDRPLLYQDGTPRQLNRAGRTIRYYRVNNGWRDAQINPGATGNAHILAQAPTQPWEVLGGNAAVNLEEALDDEDRRVRHLLADMEQLEENPTTHWWNPLAPANRLGRVSILPPLAFMFVSTLLVSSALIAFGASTGHPFVVHPDTGDVTIPWGSRFPIILGMICYAFATGVLKIGASIIGSGQKKFIKFVEFILTMATQQGALAGLGVTRDNVREIIPRVDVADEENIDRVINAIPLTLMLTMILHVAYIYAVPTWWVASIIGSVIFLRAWLDYRASKLGWEQVVLRARENHALFQWKVLPVVLVFTTLMQINHDFAVMVVGNVYMAYAWIVAFFTGKECIDTLGVWKNLLLVGGGLGVGALFVLLFGGIVRRQSVKDAADKTPQKNKWLTRAAWTLLALPGCTIIFGGIGLLGNAWDKKEICLQETPNVSYGGNATAEKELQDKELQNVAASLVAAPMVAPKKLIAMARTDGKVVLLWKDGGGDKNGFAIQRRTVRTTFAEIDSVGPNTADFLDADAQPDTTYFYRVLAVNEGGESPPSNTASVTTPEATQTAQKTEQEEQKKDVPAATSEEGSTRTSPPAMREQPTTTRSDFNTVRSKLKARLAERKKERNAARH